MFVYSGQVERAIRTVQPKVVEEYLALAREVEKGRVVDPLDLDAMPRESKLAALV